MGQREGRKETLTQHVFQQVQVDLDLAVLFRCDENQSENAADFTEEDQIAMEKHPEPAQHAPQRKKKIGDRRRREHFLCDSAIE